MSTSDDTAMSTPTPTGNTPDFIRGRDELKELFKDNATPVGSDFESLIASSFNKKDGPILPAADGGVTLENSLTVQGQANVTDALTARSVSATEELTVGADTYVGGNLSVSGDRIFLGNASEITTTSLKVGDSVSLTNDSGLHVHTNTTIEGHTDLRGMVTVDTSTQDGSAQLLVKGKVTADTLVVGSSIELGTADSQLTMTADTHADSVLVNDANGETHLLLDNDGQLSLGLPADQVNAKLHLRYRPGDADTLFRIDNRANDDTPIAVTSDGNMGIGTLSPHNALDVTGSLRIGSSDMVSPANSLSVENRLGIGTVNPMARVDVHTFGGEKALVIRDGDNTLLDVGRDYLSTDTALMVKGKTALHDTEVHAKLTVSGAAVMENTVRIDGDTKLQANAKVKGVLTVADDSQLNTLTASGKATLNNVLVVEGDTKLGRAIGIGLGTGDNHNPLASLHIKETDSQPAVKIENKEGDNQLMVSSAAVKVGQYGNPVSLNVTGRTELHGKLVVNKTLAVHELAGFPSGIEADHKITLTQTAPGLEQTALSVHSNNQNTALDVSHNNGTDVLPLLTAQVDKVGIHTNSPTKAFHVSGESQFDHSTTFIENVDIQGELNAQHNVHISGRVAVNIDDHNAHVSQFHIANPSEDIASLRVDGLTDATPALVVKDDKLGVGTAEPQHQLDVVGNARISGTLALNDLINADTVTLGLSQQSEAPAVKIGREGHDGELFLFHDKIGLNVAAPQANFHLSGSAWLDDETKARILQVTQALGVSGASQLSTTNINGKMEINSPVQSQNTDVHLRQSDGSKTAFRIDQADDGKAALVVKSGNMGINTDAPECALDIYGHVKSRQEMSVYGPFLSDSTSHFKQTALFDDSVALAVAKPQARLHVAEQAIDEAALRIDYGEGEAAKPIVVRQGKLGVGTPNPKLPLDVKGDAQVDGELLVTGMTNLDNYLNVAQDAVFSADITVKEKARLWGQAVIGRVRDIDAELIPNAQIYVADTHYKEAFRIDSADYASLVVMDGKLGIGNENPRVALDVVGEARILGKVEVQDELEVKAALKANNNIEGLGKLDISQKATFGSDVHIRGDVHIEDKLDLEEELTVLGDTALQSKLDVDGDTHLKSTLNVDGKTILAAPLEVASEVELKSRLGVDGVLTLKDALHYSGPLVSGVANARAHHHVNVPSATNALIIERNAASGAQHLFNIDSDGRVAIGKAQANKTLDVVGDADVTGEFLANSVQSNTRIYGRDVQAHHSMQIGDGPTISGFSTDFRLGSDNPADALVPTQAAVKAYIDNIVVPFGRGGKTYTISTQADFDALFNKGESTIIDTNTTVILLPLGNRDFNTTSYQLKNTVRLRSGVSIVGSNQTSTVIMKHNANARFEILGSVSQPITGITMEGFTFDGANLVASGNGGAFYLEYARDCRFNCRIQRHTTSGDGGAICGVLNGMLYTVSHIEALHVHSCYALVRAGGSDLQRNEGGAAYGLDRSTIVAYDCKAERGGAIARCRASTVEAHRCMASRTGGAAYRSPQIRLTAIDCLADAETGKGGGAYFCSDLICEGHWLNNNAAQGPHIYASNNLTGEFEERHYWKGDFIGRRIDDGTSVWRTHNE